jgi:MFS transporter, AAHS family, 4-hydroxybenzoate transporter
MKMPPQIDVAEWIDHQRISKLQVSVILMSGACTLLEGFDATSISFVAPVLVKEWHLPPQSFTPVFMAGLLGLLVGCLAIAPLADKLGRKTVMLGSVIAFGTFSLLSAFASSLPTLAILRLLTGAGVGGGMANAIALTSEFFPQRSRAGTTAAMFVGFPLGSSLGGYLAGWIIPHFGWQSVFLVGGILPLILAPALVFALPESIRHLVASGSDPERVKALLARINRTAAFAPGTHFVIVEERKSGLTVRHLFTEGRAFGTILIWVVFFMSLLDIFLVSSWLPIILRNAGLNLSTAVTVSATMQFCGAVACLITAPILNRLGCFTVLVPAYLISAVGLALFGFAGKDLGLILLSAALGGAGNITGQVTANALAAAYYPTYVRATGVGWALGIGRIGAILGPAIGGILLAFNVGPQTLFLIAAVPSLVAVVAVLVLMRVELAQVAARQPVPV